jgi:peptidoglycan lytic transglycosylase G
VSRRRPKRRRRRAPLVAVLAALLLAAAGGAGAWVWWGLFRPFQGFAGGERRVDVAPGSDARRILARLEAEGVLADAQLARAYLVYRLGDPPLKAGAYLFSGPATAPQVLARLIRGEVMQQAVTLVEGLTLEEAAEQLAAAGCGNRGALLAAMGSPALIADLDPAATDLEGYLFPDTYQLALGTSEPEVVATLVRTFRRRWAEQVAPLLPPDEDRTLREIVTLASIVEKEARIAAERPIIAGVYRNRLARGIALYADPTVIFALKRLGRWDGNLRKGDLALDSPYNTYRYPGLPPGPIASPGLASLTAAAAPADVPYLYFVSRNDGTHVFATTLAEHNRNVERWQRRYWRERWAAERRRDGN